MKNHKVLLFLLFFLPVFCLKAQTIQQVAEKLDDYNLSHPQEKLYLQLDKYAYTAGETIWFKAYTTIGISNLFSNLSGLAYVELIDASSRKIDSLIVPLGLGVGLGDISLSDTIVEGSYRLRAYTNWMRNSEDKYFYDRTIQIANGRSDNVVTTTTFSHGDKNNICAITLKTLSGVPLPKTTVRYEIIDDGKVVEKKKGTTDDTGVLTIEVSKKYKVPQVSLRFSNLEKSTVNKVVKLKGLVNTSDVQLLPEGGKLLAGFINTLGIKAVNNQGLGEKVNLIVVNGKDTLGTTLTNDLGMGSLNVYLNADDSLKVYAEYEDGRRYTVTVPEIYKQGYGIKVNNQNDSKLFAQVNVSDNLVNGEDLYFLVHHLGKVLFVSKQKANKQELAFSMERGELPSGVITITILNSKFEPIVERAIFNFNKATILPLTVSLNKQSFGHREKVEVNLQVEGIDTLKIAALSASVLNSAKIKDDYQTAPNILSSLLLSADLKGYIEKPGYYFEKDQFKALDMDYLMLTQGWRNINWKDLELHEKPKFEAEKSLSISGYTKKLGRTKPEPGAKVQIISTKNFMDFIDTVSNEEGYFKFDNLMFVDSVKFLISAKDGVKGKNNIDIIYNKPIAPHLGYNKNEPEEKWDINKLYVDEINASKKYFAQLEAAGLKEKVVAIEEVVVRASQRPKASKNSRNLNGPGNADQVITAEDLSTCPSLEICLAGRLLGVYWQAGVPYNTRGNGAMQVVLDGMFIEADQISSLNVADIESIEVLRNANYTAVYGSNGGNGLIVITTKTGDSVLRNYVPKGIITIQPQGFSMNREFYKPKYEVPNSVKYVEDLRTTIHWEPAIVTDKNGNAKFDFYTADEKGKYIIVIEGLDLFGNICRKIVELHIE